MTNVDQEEQYKREASLAAAGQQVLSNEAYQLAVTVRRAQVFEVFCSTSKDQGDVREEAWRTMKNLDALEEFFNTSLETGKMAEQSLETNNKQELIHERR